MSEYANHQIYTHSPAFGVCKGQRWVPRHGSLDGAVKGITWRGYVILSHEPKLVGPSYIPIDRFVRQYALYAPIQLNLYRRVNGEVAVQIVGRMWNAPHMDIVIGELQRDFDQRPLTPPE